MYVRCVGRNALWDALNAATLTAVITWAACTREWALVMVNLVAFVALVVMRRHDVLRRQKAEMSRERAVVVVDELVAQGKGLRDASLGQLLTLRDGLQADERHHGRRAS
jgi:hypothetical protein